MVKRLAEHNLQIILQPLVFLVLPQGKLEQMEVQQAQEQTYLHQQPHFFLVAQGALVGLLVLKRVVQ
jgi:hypothetical protein